MYYTESYKRKLDRNLQQIQDKRRQLNRQLQQKQFRAQVQRKINENKKMIEKVELGRQIQERRLNLMIENKLRDLKSRQFMKMIHEDNIDSINMKRAQKSNLDRRIFNQIVQSRSMIKSRNLVQSYLKQKQDKQKQSLTKLRNKFKSLNKTEFALRNSLTIFKSKKSSSRRHGSNKRYKSQLQVQKSKTQILQNPQISDERFNKTAKLDKD